LIAVQAVKAVKFQHEVAEEVTPPPETRGAINVAILVRALSKQTAIINGSGLTRSLLSRLLHSDHLLVFPIILLATVIRLFLFYSVPYITKSDETLYAHMAYYALSGSGFKFWLERSYFYPMILLSAIVFSHPGITHVWDPYLLTVTRAFNLTIDILCVLLIYLVGRSIGGKNTGLFASFLLSICWLDAFWGFRPVSEIPATLFLLISLLFTARALLLNSRIRFFLAGLFLGFSFMARFQSLLLFIPLAAVFSRKRDHLKYAASGLMLAVLIQGVVDLISWGSFLSSPWNFFVLNVLSGRSARWGRKPFLYYLERIPGIVGWGVLILAFLALLNLDSYVSLLWLSITAYVGVFSFIAHKERRFLVPIIPMFYLLAALGFARLEEKVDNRTYRTLLWLLFLLPELYLGFDTIWAIASHQFLVP